MSARIPLPKARVGDVIVADVHPKKGFVMFKVGSAYHSKDFHWIYVSLDGEIKVNELWVEKIYKQKGLK